MMLMLEVMPSMNSDRSIVDALERGVDGRKPHRTPDGEPGIDTGACRS
jgi:hypothetical protein